MLDRVENRRGVRCRCRNVVRGSLGEARDDGDDLGGLGVGRKEGAGFAARVVTDLEDGLGDGDGGSGHRGSEEGEVGSFESGHFSDGRGEGGSRLVDIETGGGDGSVHTVATCSTGDLLDLRSR